jgi:hypothetical protein
MYAPSALKTRLRGKYPGPSKILAYEGGTSFGYPQRDLLCWKFTDLLKSQISNYKYQTMSNERNSKIQTMSILRRCWSPVESPSAMSSGLKGPQVKRLNIGIYDLIVIWCLEFVILETKLQGRAIYFWLPLSGIYDTAQLNIPAPTGGGGTGSSG